MTNYHPSSTKQKTTLDSKQKRKQLLDQVRHRRAMIQKRFKEKLEKMKQVTDDF